MNSNNQNTTTKTTERSEQQVYILVDASGFAEQLGTADTTDREAVNLAAKEIRERMTDDASVWDSDQWVLHRIPQAAINTLCSRCGTLDELLTEEYADVLEASPPLAGLYYENDLLDDLTVDVNIIDGGRI